MELENIFPSKYVKATDLKGTTPTLTISRAEIEKLGEDNKLVIYFQNREKGLVCNRTNADRIAMLYGTNTDGWIGNSITLYTDLVNFQNRVVEAIRVRPPARRGNGSIQAPLPQSQPPQRQHVTHERPDYTLSTTEAIQQQSDDNNIPF